MEVSAYHSAREGELYKTAADIARVKACGVNAVLIGEALMRAQGNAISTMFPRNGN